MTRVEQDEWVSPKFAAWAVRLGEYLERSTRPVVLIAHSLGTSLITRWALNADCARVAGAFMVAPSDRGEADVWPKAATNGFAPMVFDRLPFPAMVLASRNDPYVAFERAELFAEHWGATSVDVGHVGHMGNSDKMGLWPLGLVHLESFVGSLGRVVRDDQSTLCTSGFTRLYATRNILKVILSWISFNLNQIEGNPLLRTLAAPRGADEHVRGRPHFGEF